MRDYIYNYNEICLYHGHFPYKIEINFYKITFYCQHNFPPLHETLCADRVELFAEESELFTHAVFQLVFVRKTASSERILQGSKRWKSEGAKPWLYRGWGLYYFSCLIETFEFLKFCNACTYRSEFSVVTPWRIPLIKLLHFPWRCKT